MKSDVPATGEGIEAPAVVSAAVSERDRPIKELDNYRWRPMWISHIGCLKAAAEYLSVRVSTPWLFGTTGYAFLLNIHKELCPSGWHVVDMPIQEALRNVGLNVDHLVEARHAWDSTGVLQERAWEHTRRAIKAGKPCYGYDLEIGDYYAIHGYDGRGYYYSGPGCDQGKGPLPWQDYGVTNQVGIIHINAVTPCDPAEDTLVVRNALELALKQAASVEGANELYACGLAGYDQWIAALEGGCAEGWGAPYNAACYAETRHNAVAFLEEAKQRIGNEQLDGLFDEAIGHYEKVAAALKQVAATFPTLDEKPSETLDVRVRRGVESLNAARGAEERGLKALEKLAQTVDPMIA